MKDRNEVVKDLHELKEFEARFLFL